MSANQGNSGQQAEEEAVAEAYSKFEERVRRTVYLDNLSPKVTVSVVSTALEQVGAVVKVEFIVNYTIPYKIPQSALVEMEGESQAKAVVDLMTDFPFMMAGAPRPVRAQLARVEMFHDRPSQPGKKVQFSWLNRASPQYEVAGMQTSLLRKHEKENLALIQIQVKEEEDLAKEQQKKLDESVEMLQMVENVLRTPGAQHLARSYGIKFKYA